MGSFATAPLAKLIHIDNLLRAYFVISVAAAVVTQMGRLYPTLLVQERSPKKKKESRTSMIQEFKKIGPILKKSTLVRVLIAFTLMAKERFDELEPAVLQALAESEDPYLRQMARRVLQKSHPDLVTKRDEIDREMSLTERILQLKTIAVFEGLSVGELAAIGSVTEEACFAAGETVVKEGDRGDRMYFIGVKDSKG